MKTFTVSISPQLDKTMNQLRKDLDKPSRAEVFRLGIALLKLAEEARKEGLKLVVADKNYQIRREIVLPG